MYEAAVKPQLFATSFTARGTRELLLLNFEYIYPLIDIFPYPFRDKNSRSTCVLQAPN